MNINPFNFLPYIFNTPRRQAPQGPYSPYLDKKFIAERAKLAREIETVVCHLIQNRLRSDYFLEDVEVINKLKQEILLKNPERPLANEYIADLWLNSLIKLYLENVEQRLQTCIDDRILISQSLDLASLLLRESTPVVEYVNQLTQKLDSPPFNAYSP